MAYDAVVVAAHSDDAEIQMGGTIAKLVERGQRILLVDITDGEPSDFAERGVRARQAQSAAEVLGVDRISLGYQDRLLTDSTEVRLAVARVIREHQPRWVYGTGEACVHPDHAAAVGVTRAAVFLARLDHWDRVPGGDHLAGTRAWAVQRLFFPHCKMEPAWSDFAFGVDVSAVYDRKQRAIACYETVVSVRSEGLLSRHEAEDRFYGRLLGVGYAEVFRAASPLLVEDPTIFAPGEHA